MVIISLILAICFLYYALIFLQNEDIVVGCMYALGAGIFLHMFISNFPLNSVVSFFNRIVG